MAVIATSDEFRNPELIPEKEQGLLEDFKRKLLGS